MSLDIPSSDSSTELKKLIDLITSYNKISDKEENSELRRLFYLQKINYLTKYSTNHVIIQWKNQFDKNGLESHLQKYGVHRDSSLLLQSIEFANAVSRLSPPLRGSSGLSQTDFYKAMQERDKLFTNDPIQENIANYIQCNQIIKAYYQQDQQLQEKVQRNLYYLSLVYAKVDAIQGFVHQEFSEYQTEVLGNPEGNNKNFTFTIESEPVKTVIRVEDRNTIGKEQQLQTYQVSEYFSEDYATIMIPFLNDDSETAYQPVVISEFASKGDLARYAEKLKGQDQKDILEQTVFFISKLGDFCTKLMDSGHYHPDIKLSNFLTDGKRLIVSDRKTITAKKNPKVNEISSSPTYGAPEYQKCLRTGSLGLNFRAFTTTLDMPSYMSFQVGAALKEFMLKSNLIPYDEQSEEDFKAKFSKWQSLSKFANPQPPTNELKNISVLVQELTRQNSKDRLPIKHFQILLKKVTLSPDSFMQELEKLSPASKLSSSEYVEDIRTILTADTLDEKLEEKLGQMDPIRLENLFQDPRFHSESLFKGKALTHANRYFKSVDEALLAKDLERASGFRWFLHKISFGLISVPRVSILNDIKNNVPKMDKITEACFILSALAGNETFPGLDANKKELLEQISDLEESSEVDKQASKEKESNHRCLSQSTKSSTSELYDTDECDVIIHDIDEKEINEGIKRVRFSVKSNEKPVHDQHITRVPSNVEDIVSTIKRGNKVKNGLISMKESVAQEEATEKESLNMKF
ncbi:protein kinase domain containing protein [Legionella gratiana]|uniref:Protein kinase domain containing protein n=1 Tax=Legionella gratiana TaxID=45066 RepID=A0A378JEX4_9GAMM|nr:hypothetical protein [Legionella gratiana]KTD06604.1 protein kinase domain containing protein [Legionella gratiana]STX45568.1 protein kinase domain containing protein [Legionella gratiana]